MKEIENHLWRLFQLSGVEIVSIFILSSENPFKHEQSSGKSNE